MNGSPDHNSVRAERTNKMSLRFALGWIIGTIFSGCGVLQAAQQQSVVPAAAPESQYRAVLDRYCVTCHNERLKTADLMLDKMDVGKVSEGAPVWEKVVRKLRTRAMPPSGAPRPDNSTYDSFATYLETELDRAAAARPNPGRPTIHRLNRAEYANAVRDIFALDVDGKSLLPADDSGEGFDNIADVLAVSPTLMERYLSAARKIARLAVGDPAIQPSTDVYNVPKLLVQDDRVSEDLPLGTRGGTAFQHFFPADGEYMIQIRLQRSNGEDAGHIYGIAEPNQIEVRLDGARVKLFTIGGEHKAMSTSFTAFGDSVQQDYERSADEALQVRFPVKAGAHLVGADFLKENTETEGPLYAHLSAYESTVSAKRYYMEGSPAIESVSISGPYGTKGLGETASRRRIFSCHPGSGTEEESCAGKILLELTRLAYRRPVTEADVQPLVNIYNAGRARGDFEGGVRLAIQALLASPQFLFRVETDPVATTTDSVHRVSDLDLASRLSFFLWSSIPDEQLLDLAARGKLADRETLEHQVRRMLADPRSKALVSNFAGQWLLLRNLRSISPDPDEFPDFDDNLRQAFQKETELFFESQLRDDRSVLGLLNADYTFVDERLAKYYGIPNVRGSNFRRVTITDENRRGLLGQGSLLTLTSYATRTSVVLRGKWLLENVLGTPPPPPPPNVPSLKDRGSDGKILSVRQQMEQHRADPVCASCHSRMDPLGFALENFDAVGKWRTTEGPAKTLIDSSGALPDGTKFQGPAELRKLLLSRPDQFVTTVTEKLLTYALGRAVEYSDAPAVRKIVRDAAVNDYRWSSIILGVVRSTPFQMRRSQES